MAPGKVEPGKLLESTGGVPLWIRRPRLARHVRIAQLNVEVLANRSTRTIGSSQSRETSSVGLACQQFENLVLSLGKVGEAVDHDQR